MPRFVGFTGDHADAVWVAAEHVVAFYWDEERAGTIIWAIGGGHLYVTASVEEVRSALAG